MIEVKEQRLNFQPEEFINFENNSTDYFIYAFIAPQPLNSKEQLEIEKYKNYDPEYYRGVHEGWNVLFLGSTGIHAKNEMLKKESA